jgi:WD40 repeat protein
VWEASTGKVVAVLEGHTAEVNSAVFSRDGKWVVTASSDDTARVWKGSRE